MELSSFDVLTPGLPVVFCGINPSLLAAQSGHNFGAPSNRFWRALHGAGFTPRRLHTLDDRCMLQYGCGITATVARGTRRASDLKSSEFPAGDDALQRKIRQFQPETLAFLGKAAFVAITGRSQLRWGLQSISYAGARVWILPNPSGLNRNFTLDDLIEAYANLRKDVAPALDKWTSTWL